MDRQLGLDDIGDFVSSDEAPRVYIGCSLTSPDTTGLRDELLTIAEFVFRECGFKTYNPARFTPPTSPHYDYEVAAIDHSHAMASDLIFFIRIQPSIGMGIEAQIAADMLIPWGDAQYFDFSKLTPLIGAMPNRVAPSLRLNESHTTREAFERSLRERLTTNRIRTEALRIRRAKDAARNVISKSDFGRQLRRQRLLLGLSAAELGVIVDLAPWWIAAIEQDSSILPCLSLLQMVRLTDALRLQFVGDSRNSNLSIPKLDSVEPFEPALLAAAVEYVEYSLRPQRNGEPQADTDEKMVSHWQEWLAGKNLTLKKNLTTSLQYETDLRATIEMPMSGLESSDVEKRNEVVAAVQRACAGVPGIQIELLIPTPPPGRVEAGEEIYLKKLAKLQRCDLGLILASPPATGVGVMASLFANSTLPSIVLTEDGIPVSKMLTGLYGRRLGDVVSFGGANIEVLLHRALIDRREAICASAARRRPVVKKATQR